MIASENLSKQFNKRFVLDNINMKISKGERVVFVGRNGSGKTTFIRCLLGLYNFDGTLTVDGINPRHDRMEVLKRIGYVPQTPPPINMTAAELIRYAADVSNKPLDTILEAAKTLMLDADMDMQKSFMKLSGGMKQKLLIAIAMGRGNDIIIIDEPTSNLDPDSRKIFYDLISNFPDNATILLTSHRAEELSFFANRVIEMDYGRVLRDEVVG